MGATPRRLARSISRALGDVTECVRALQILEFRPLKTKREKKEIGYLHHHDRIRKNNLQGSPGSIVAIAVIAPFQAAVDVKT